MLRSTHNQSANYSAPCEGCFDNYFTKDNKQGCACHVGAPRTLHNGNPRSSEIAQEAVKRHRPTLQTKLGFSLIAYRSEKCT